MVKSITNENGITIKDLKEFLLNRPEQDSDGNQYEVWVMTGFNISNVAKRIELLNVSKKGSDIIITPGGVTLW